MIDNTNEQIEKQHRDQRKILSIKKSSVPYLAVARDKVSIYMNRRYSNKEIVEMALINTYADLCEFTGDAAKKKEAIVKGILHNVKMEYENEQKGYPF